jgi:hypothetical protein
MAQRVAHREVVQLLGGELVEPVVVGHACRLRLRVPARCDEMAAMTPGYRVCLALLAVAALLPAGCGGSDGGGDSTSATTSTAAAAASRGPQLGPPFGSMAALPGILRTRPPWLANNGNELQLRLRAIGLDPLRQEGQVVHIHQHLDIFVDGKPVEVPGDLGIGQGFISDLHTHASYPPGIIHVESPTVESFTLGQFFAVWGVQLSPRCIGGLCEAGDKRLRTWVDGKLVTADPTRIELAEHQEIVLAYGTHAQMPKPVPASYDFAAVGL